MGYERGAEMIEVGRSLVQHRRPLLPDHVNTRFPVTRRNVERGLTLGKGKGKEQNDDALSRSSRGGGRRSEEGRRKAEQGREPHFVIGRGSARLVTHLGCDYLYEQGFGCPFAATGFLSICDDDSWACQKMTVRESVESFLCLGPT
jgi:hypothetical protein